MVGIFNNTKRKFRVCKGKTSMGYKTIGESLIQGHPEKNTSEGTILQEVESYLNVEGSNPQAEIKKIRKELGKTSPV